MSGVADQHGDKVTGAVAAASGFVNDKTGGRPSRSRARSRRSTAKAVDKLKSDAACDE